MVFIARLECSTVRTVRVLVTSTAGAGHVQAIVPLAGALRSAGHDVRWAISSDGVADVERLGFAAVAAGMPVAERRAQLAPELPRIMALPPSERRGDLFAGFFATAAAPRMWRDLAPIIDQMRPDLVVHETAELAAAALATARGISHVTVAFSGALPAAAVPMVLDAIAPVWELEGLGVPDEAALAGSIYFHPFPPSFGGAPRLETVLPMRPGTVSTASTAPPWLSAFARDRPGVYLTAGTERAAPDAPWRAAVEAIAALDVDAIATLGEHVDPALLGTIPANLRVERFVPQRLVFDRVQVVMSHAGAGTMLGAAACGIPQVLTPLFADQWENAVAVSGAGAGVMLEPDQRSASIIRAALSRALNEPSIMDAGLRVAAEIEAMPTADHHVPALERLAGD
jgi:UDP:flavonoid glycosyltransferase YjiC (YdhE family)